MPRGDRRAQGQSGGARGGCVRAVLRRGEARARRRRGDALMSDALMGDALTAWARARARWRPFVCAPCGS
eukprot:6203687-Pleurochrysis_carterae.AAC.1